jgi:hypothetical protein
MVGVRDELEVGSSKCTLPAAGIVLSLVETLVTTLLKAEKS